MEHFYSLLLYPPDTGWVSYAINGNIIGNVIMLVFLLFFSALFSAAEVAFFSLRPEDLESMKKRSPMVSRTVFRLVNTPDRLYFSILVINTMVNLAFILLSYSLSNHLLSAWENISLKKFISIISIFFILIIFGEILPKSFASRRYMGFTLIMAFPIAVFEFILRPITSIATFPTLFVRQKTGLLKTNIIDELSDVLEQTDTDLNEDEKILKGVVNFSNINVSTIMCPRIDITAFDIKDNFDDIIPVIIESGYSRIPVYSESFDNVKGILYAKDILPFMDKRNNFKWQELVRAPFFIPETKKINALLQELQTKKIHMAVVIDDYGGTSGIVTLEDIIEEIVGEISDESDENEILYRKIDDNYFVFKGKVMLDDFIEILGFEKDPFESVRGQSETLAGLILELTGEIPELKHEIKFQNLLFTIEGADKRRITSIRVKIFKKKVDSQENPENEQ